ncbi:Crp/Fnr family transcriptional regulator [Vibrio sp. NTOU-M3]|uniref:Crp/Fnr family transcriptional regulator n=1 Tax=Vibrio sp. NTOU-M3 TaxID=3234954 RepID=UPI00349F6EE7
MEQSFINNLDAHGFTQDEIQELCDLATPLELPTRHILVHQGEEASDVYFIIEGICHAAYLTEKGKEFSKEFYWEQDWVIGFESLIKHQPSPYLIESLTPCKMLCLPVETLRCWREERHSLYIKLLETQLMYKENKERFMLLYTAEERYELLRQNFPNLIERVNDCQIAAYLGITPISLSRIKKRISS